VTNVNTKNANIINHNIDIWTSRNKRKGRRAIQRELFHNVHTNYAIAQHSDELSACH